METKAALGAAGGIALMIAGATSALLLTIGQGSAPENSGAPAAVVTEYVDQFGNPIDPMAVSPATPEVIITTGVDTQVELSEEYEEAEYEGEEEVDHEEADFEEEDDD